MNTVTTADITVLPLSDIFASPENDQLYRPVDLNDPAIIALAESIREHGVQDPLIVDRYGTIISGHRRRVAAHLAGLHEVPCIVREDVCREDDLDQFVSLLRECNRQRVKSFDETLREEAVSVNPEEAYRLLIEEREQKSRLGDFHGGVDLGGKKTRKQISKAKQPMIDAIIKVLDALRKYWPVSVRKVHYDLLNDPPLIHASKPDSTYRNDKASYHALTEIITRARIFGLIPWNSTADEQRVSEEWNVQRESSIFTAWQLDQFCKGYYRDLMQSQANHVELFVEKFTLEGIVRPIASEYCIPLTIGKGMCSSPPRHNLLKRYLKSGKEMLIVLLVSDHDPDGVVIGESFARSMRDDFGVTNIIAVKVALTPDQVNKYKLTRAMEAKKSSKNYSKFVKRYGTDTYELEALKPADLETIIRESIDAVIDVEAFNHEIGQERREAAELTAYRRSVLKLIGGAA